MTLNSAVRIGVFVLAPALFSASIDRDAARSPRVSHIDPQVVAPAEIVTAYGVNLDRSRVEELILANGERTAITHIVQQWSGLIRFRVPPSLEPGEYQIVLVIGSRWGTELVDQHVVLTVVSTEGPWDSQ